ncbi:hypothetical protein [Gloeocapsopsis crepidinum]|uniref:hypothetical protein n=1 Tax=Gloeocapsopsis crepidinum TaxID=693223 RepID=UPI001D13D7D7|nr:hypothetical protein [Gloeocapsopsis crepidinum]
MAQSGILFTPTINHYFCRTTPLEIGIYYFVNAMITISAIIFLYPPTLPVAAVAIVNMDDAGDTAAAAAMATLIVFTSIGVRILYWFLTRGVQQRTQAWRLSKGCVSQSILQQTDITAHNQMNIAGNFSNIPIPPANRK